MNSRKTMRNAQFLSRYIYLFFSSSQMFIHHATGPIVKPHSCAEIGGQLSQVEYSKYYLCLVWNLNYLFTTFKIDVIQCIIIF